MIIGEKKDFAVEYSFDSNYPKNMGYGRIWIDNHPLGTFEDLIYLDGYLMGLLYAFKNAKELSHELSEFSEQDLFDLLLIDDKGFGVSGSTFTDNFYIFSYRKENNVFVLWKLIESGGFHDLENYKREIISVHVPLTLLIDIIDQVEIEFNSKGIINDT